MTLETLRQSLLGSLLTLTLISGCADTTSTTPTLSGTTPSGINSTQSNENVNTDIRGSLSSEDDIDTFSFTAQSTGTVAFAWNSTLHSLYVRLYENGDQVSYDYDGYFTGSIIAGHTYNVEISSYSYFGDYIINIVTTNDDRGDAHLVLPNKSYSATFNELNSTLAVYNFTATSTGAARVKANWVGSSSYMYLYVYENGEYIAYDYGSSNAEPSFNIVEGKTYSVLAYATDTDSVDLDYTIEFFTSNDLRGDAVAATPNHPYQSKLNSDSDAYDVYNFTAASTGVASAKIDWIGNNYAYIYIYHNGEYQAYDYGTTGAETTFDTIVDHNYTVLVSMTESNHVDLEYTFELSTKNDARGDAITLAPNSAKSVIMNENENFFETFNFTARSTGVVRIDTTWVGTTNYIYTYAYQNGEYQAYDYGTSKTSMLINTIEGKQYSFLIKAEDTDNSDVNITLNIASCDDANSTILTLEQDYISTLNAANVSMHTLRFTPTTTVDATAKMFWSETSTYAYMYLYENGNYIAYDYGSTNTVISRTFTAGRTYTFMVFATDTNNANMDYTFNIKQN